MSRVNQARDAQAFNFGVNSAVASGQQAPQFAGTLSASAAGPPPTVTTDHNSANANDLAQSIIISTNTSAVWASANVVWGLILSNTAAASSVVTVDGWWTLANAAGSIPLSTSLYVVIAATPPFQVMALTDSVAAVIGTETGTALLGTEQTTNGLTRALVTTWTHTAGASTGTIGKTFTYTGGSSQAIGRSALVNSQTSAAGSGRGNFAFFVDQLNGSSGYFVANNGDTIQITYTITYTTVP